MTRLSVEVFSVALIAVMIVVLSVSFAAIVFNGPLAPLLDRGIGTTLIGTAIFLTVGAFLFSYRGIISNPQDLTAVLLAGAAANISISLPEASEDVLTATILALLASAAIVSGVFMLAIGKLKLSYLIRFIPYPVMGGFLAATGYLLVVGAIGMLTDQPLDIWSLGSVFDGPTLMLWLPWILVSAGIAVVTRLTNNPYALPGCLGVTCAGFFALFLLPGWGIEEARSSGLLLGPFGSGGFVGDLHVGMIFMPKWDLVLEQGTTLIAVVIMTYLGSALNLSGIELAIKKQFDADKDFVAIGVSNILAGPSGGVMGFPGFAASVLAHRLRLRQTISGLAVAAICAAVALAGAELLEMLPRGLFGALIGYLGLDLLITWLWGERARLMARDYSIVVLILVVSAVFGFLEALAVGIAVSVVLFVIAYAQQDFVRLRTNLSLRRSTIERDLAELDQLVRHGNRVRILEFSAYLFFGSAARLREMVGREIADSDPKIETLILDFTRVQGIDPSAAHSLGLVRETCNAKGVELVLSGLTGQNRETMRRFTGGQQSPDGGLEFVSLDAALEAAEERILDEHLSDGGARSFHQVLVQRNPDFDLEREFEKVSVPAGEKLFSLGEQSDEMYILIEGIANVSIPTGEDSFAIVARLRPGALIGEIAYYGDALRSADVIAKTDATLLRIDRDVLQKIERSDPKFVASFLGIAAMYLSRRMDRSTRLLSAVLD